MWGKLHRNALQLLKRDLYAPVSTQDARETLQSRSLGTSKLRLVPKKTGPCWQCSACTPLDGARGCRLCRGRRRSSCAPVTVKLPLMDHVLSL